MKKNLLALTIGAILALIGAEIGLRFFWHPDVLKKAYLRDDLSWIQNNVKLNAYGYRDSELELKKDTKKLRVYSLGDSFTYGWYVNDPDLAYPNWAEKILKEKNIPVEIINASQPGFKPKDALERFKNEGLTMAPDVITLGVNIYDLTGSEFAPRYTQSKLLRKSLLYQLTFGNMERARVAAKTEIELQNSISDNSENLQKFSQTVNQFRKFTSETGAKFVLIVFPNYDPANPNLDYGYDLFHAQVKKIAQAEGIDVIDLLASYDAVGDRRKLVLNPLDDHPGILAHQIAGKELANYLEQNIVTRGQRPNSQNIRSQSFKIGESLPDKSVILSLGSISDKWVYFDLANGLDVQKKVLTDRTYRRLDYLVDYLKTAKPLAHAGWPGAKIEYNVPGGELITIPLNLYGYRVFGLNQLTGYWKDDNYQRSNDIDYSDLKVTRNQDNLIINIKGGNQFDLYRISLDIIVSQVNFEEGKLHSIAETQVLSGVRKEKLFFPIKSPVSISKYSSRGNTQDYYWSNNLVVFGSIQKTENSIAVESAGQTVSDTVEIAVMQENSQSNESPNIEYLVY